MKQSNLFSKKSLLIRVVASVAVWLVFCAYAAVSYNTVVKKIESAKTNIAHVESLAPEIETVRAYRSAVGDIRAMLDASQSNDDIVTILAKDAPGVPAAEVVETRVAVLPNSVLNMKTTTLMWRDINLSSLSEIIHAAENAEIPHRITSLSVTPQKFGDTAQITAAFTTFLK